MLGISRHCDEIAFNLAERVVGPVDDFLGNDAEIHGASDYFIVLRVELKHKKNVVSRAETYN